MWMRRMRHVFIAFFPMVKCKLYMDYMQMKAEVRIDLLQ